MSKIGFDDCENTIRKQILAQLIANFADTQKPYLTVSFQFCRV